MVHKTFLLAIANFPTHDRELSARLHLSKVIPVIDLDLSHVFLVLMPLYKIVHANNGQIIWLAVWLTAPTDVRAETEADVNKIRLKNRQLLITTLELHPRSTCLFLTSQELGGVRYCQNGEGRYNSFMPSPQKPIGDALSASFSISVFFTHYCYSVICVPIREAQSPEILLFYPWQPHENGGKISTLPGVQNESSTICYRFPGNYKLVNSIKNTHKPTF